MVATSIAILTQPAAALQAGSSISASSAFHGMALSSSRSHCGAHHARRIPTTLSLSDREIHEGLRLRAATLELEAAKREGPVVLDGKEAKNLYFRQFWKSRNLGGAKRSPSDSFAVPAGQPSDGDGGSSGTNSGDTDGLCNAAAAVAVDMTPPTHVQQAYYHRPLSAAASSPALDAQRGSWSDEELFTAASQYYELARALRGVSEVSATTLQPAAVPSLLTQMSNSFRDAMGQQPSGFLERAELKHSRAAMLALLILVVSDIIQGGSGGGSGDSWAIAALASLLQGSSGVAHAHAHARAAADSIPSLLAGMVAVAAAVEANLYFGNGQSLSAAVSSAADGFLRRAARTLAVITRPDAADAVTEEVVAGDGQRLARLARSAEVGHGRVAILAILALQYCM